MSISIHRFAPTPAAKFGLTVDLAVLAMATALATYGSAPFRIGWAICALIVFWSTSSAVRHYAYAAEREAWEDVVLTALNLLAVATVMAIGGWLLPWPHPELMAFLALALPSGPAPSHRLRLRTLARPSPRQVLIVGTGALGRISGEDLERRRSQCSYLSWPGERIPEPLRGRYLGESGELPRVLQAEVFDEVYLWGSPHLQERSLQTAVGTCETFGVPFALPAYSVRLGRAQPMATKAVKDGFLHYATGSVKAELRFVKRVLDIAGSAAALWVLFPFLLAVAALVKLTSRGTVFFRQLRVGLHGKKFHMLKFRSMVANAEELKAKLAAQNEQAGPVFKMKAIRG